MPILASAPSPVTPIAIHDHSPLPGFASSSPALPHVPPACFVQSRTRTIAAQRAQKMCWNSMQMLDLVCERVSTPMGDVAVCSAAENVPLSVVSAAAH